MALPKLYDRIIWHNDTEPALNEDNLNAMSKGLDDVDDRLIDLAGTIMEDVPQIIEDMEVLEPAIATIDANVERSETAADNAEVEALKSEGYAAGTQDGVEVTSGEYYQNNAKYYAEIANPPIENTVDFTDIIAVTDAINKAAKDVRLKVEAVQDLHGYNNPWVYGAGKNLINMTVSGIKSANTDGTWSGNAYTLNGVVFTLLTDSDDNVTGININGPIPTQFDMSYINLGTVPFDSSKSYFMTGGLTDKQYLVVQGMGSIFDKGSGRLITNLGETKNIQFVVLNATNNVKIYPQVEIGTRASTFESPTNICPISGWTGAKPTVVGDNLFNGTYNEFVYCPIPKNTQFTASIDASASGVYFGVYDKYKNTIDYWILSNTTPDGNRKYRVITLAKDVYYVKFYSAQANNYAVKLGDDKVFSPYATTYTISFDGTRYGGTLDVTSGVLTVDKAYKDLSTLTWTYQAEGTRFQTGGIDAKAPASAATKGNIICSQYKTVSSNDTWNVNNGVVALGSQSQVQVRDTRYTDATTFTNAMDGVQIVYELATPQTIQLTPTQVYLLYGYNTLFGDCGDISLTYDASGIIHIEEAKLDTETLKTIAAASSDFADFKARIAAL